jgi:RNA polymerase sigma-70 factor (ECF subfamily)
MRLGDVPRDLVLDAAQSLEGFERLHGLVSPDVYALAYSLVQNHDDAEEVYSEVMLRLYRHLPNLQDASAFGGWAVRIVVNATRTVQARKNQLRTLGALGRGTALGIDGSGEMIPMIADRKPGPRDRAEGREMQAAVQRAMAQLPPRQREAVILFEMRGMDLAEVAAIMECSTGAVKFHLHEGRKKLRQLLKPWMTEAGAR